MGLDYMKRTVAKRWRSIGICALLVLLVPCLGANELTLTAALEFTKSTTHTDSRNMGVEGKQFTVSGTDCVGPITQTIGTSAEALDIGDITTPGYIIIKNLDATNYVTIRMGSTGADVVKLKAGEFALFRLASTNPFALANTGACQVLFALIED
jgi:hypothetical protein